MRGPAGSLLAAVAAVVLAGAVIGVAGQRRVVNKRAAEKKAKASQEEGGTSTYQKDVDRRKLLKAAGWNDATPSAEAHLGTERCTIDRKPAADIDEDVFLKEYFRKKPLIITFPQGLESWTDNVMNFSRKALLKYRHLDVKVGHSEYIPRYGGEGYNEVNLGDFLNSMNVKELGRDLEPPSVFDQELFDGFDLSLNTPAYMDIGTGDDWLESFRLGSERSGVSFHHRSDTFLFCAHGATRLMNYEPCDTPPGGYYSGISAVEWVKRLYPNLTETQMPVECMMRGGEFAYIPEGWYHSSLNIADTFTIVYQNLEKDKLGSWYNDLVDAVDENNSPPEAAALLDKVLKRKPKCAEAYFIRGSLFTYKATALDNKIVYLERAVRIVPSFVLAEVELGRAIWLRGKGRRNWVRKEAESHFRRALQLAPLCMDARTSWAKMLNELELHQEALAILYPPPYPKELGYKSNVPAGHVFHRELENTLRLLKGEPACGTASDNEDYNDNCEPLDEEEDDDDEVEEEEEEDGDNENNENDDDGDDDDADDDASDDGNDGDNNENDIDGDENDEL